MKRILFTLVMITVTVISNAQIIQGNVVDEQDKPMEYATVAVLDAADSAYVAGGLTDAEGRFSVNVGRTFDGLMLRVTSMGYAEKYEALPLSGPVRMRQKSTALGEVTVTGARKYVKTNATGLTVSMEGNPLAKLGSAADAIRMMPMIDASGGGISVLGKGAPEIYVNNRKLRDRGELNRMSPEDIKSVDIITTPTAKYGSSVTSVIIIHTKKRNEGLAGIISGGGSQAEVASGWANADFSYMLANGLGFYVNGNVSNDGYKQDREYTEDSGGGILHTQTAGVYKGRSTSVNATAGGSYDFGESNSVGVRYEYSRTPKDNYHALSDILTRVDGEESAISSTNNVDGQSTRHYLNAYFAMKLGAKKNYELTADADYMYGTNGDNQLTEERVQTESDMIRTSNKAAYHLIATKANLSMDLGKVSIDVGGEYSHTTNRTDFASAVTDAAVTGAEDYVRQDLAGGYVDLVYSPNKHWTFIGGVRFEATSFDYFKDGSFVGNQSKSYTDWLPKAVVSYAGGDWRVTLSYGSNVYRPSYSMLNNNYTYVTHTSWETGNPLLLPSMPKTLNLGLTWKQTMLSASYIRRRHGVEYVYTYLPDERINLRSPVNLPSSDLFTVSLSHSMDIGFWHPMLQGTASISNLSYGSPRQDYDKPLFVVGMQNRFDLPWGVYAYLIGSWMSKGHNNTYYFDDSASVSVILSKRFGNWSVNLYGNDVLGTWRQKHTSAMNGVSVLEYRKGASRQVMLTVRYTFKNKKTYKGKGTGSSEIQRF